MSDLTLTSTSNTRVAIVTTVPAPYRLPVFNRLAELPGVDLQLVFGDGVSKLAYWDTSLGEPKFNYTLQRTVALPLPIARGDKRVIHWSPELWRYLSKQRFDVLVALGWTMPNTFLVWLYGKLHHCPVILWDESIPHTPGRYKKLLMPLLKKYFGSFDGYLAASHACIEYTVEMGASRDRVFLMPQVTHNAFYANHAAEFRKQYDAIKQEIGISTPKTILYVGQLSIRKNVLQLLEAFRTLAQQRSDASLVMVGAGPLRDELLARIHAYGLQDRVFVLPFVAQAVLPKYYAVADVFVLPSLYDTFGVVVAEAMACGLPIVTTDMVGAASSIVGDGVNGLVVEHGNQAALAQALEKIMADDSLRRAMGAESERIIASWDVERLAQNFSKMLQVCTSQPRKPQPTRSGAVPES